MALTISNGEYESFISRENRHELHTFTPAGGDIRITPDENIAEQGEGYLIRSGEQVSDFNPEGEVWYAVADGSDVDLHVTHRFHFGRQGGVD